jgi:hypothetical protein
MSTSWRVGDVFEGYPQKAQKVVHVVTIAHVVRIVGSRERRS